MLEWHSFEADRKSWYSKAPKIRRGRRIRQNCQNWSKLVLGSCSDERIVVKEDEGGNEKLNRDPRERKEGNVPGVEETSIK